MGKSDSARESPPSAEFMMAKWLVSLENDMWRLGDEGSSGEKYHSPGRKVLAF